MFPARKKSRKVDEIVHKKFVLATETFEFGPLLVGKSRDKSVAVFFHTELYCASVRPTSLLKTG